MIKTLVNPSSSGRNSILFRHYLQQVSKRKGIERCCHPIALERFLSTTGGGEGSSSGNNGGNTNNDTNDQFSSIVSSIGGLFRSSPVSTTKLATNNAQVTPATTIVRAETTAAAPPPPPSSVKAEAQQEASSTGDAGVTVPSSSSTQATTEVLTAIEEQAYQEVAHEQQQKKKVAMAKLFGHQSHDDEVYKEKKWKKGLITGLMGDALQQPAGPLIGTDVVEEDNDLYIPEVSLYSGDGLTRKRVLILCTGGTLTMAPDKDGSLAPVEGALSEYMKGMHELYAPNMPEVVVHEYSPFYDSSSLGPADWATVAKDIRSNYLHFDGFVVLTGTDTMAYIATALSFMLENLGKPVIFTGSQIPLCEPYNDARRNLIMSLIFASRDTINEVSIFFHDRLLRACRATKVNTHKLLAFDSPNMSPLASIGITIDENEHLILPPARGALKVHTTMDTRLLTIRLVPGFDDEMIREMVEHNINTDRHHSKKLKALVLQLYGTGNIPTVKDSFIELLADATSKGILVVASTQCHSGSVLMGHYATGKALLRAGVVSASDMTVEAIACKVAYLFGRGDLSFDEVASLMAVSLRGEVTPPEALSPPPLSSAYQRARRKGRRFY